jgi:hypothetical protein
VIEFGTERQFSYDIHSYQCSRSNSSNSPAHDVKGLVLDIPVCRIFTVLEIFLLQLPFCSGYRKSSHHHPRDTCHQNRYFRSPTSSSISESRDGSFLGLGSRHMKRKYIARIFVYRIALALLTRTLFQPDEFFQSLEVAHAIVFGYGKLTWEWQRGVAIRSIVYPALYVPVYWALRVTGLDATRMLVCEFANIAKCSSVRSECVARYMHPRYSMV